MQVHRWFQIVYLDLINDLIEEHKETFDETDIRDVIDAYLLEMRKNENHFSVSTISIRFLLFCIHDHAIWHRISGCHSQSPQIRWLPNIIYIYIIDYSQFREMAVWSSICNTMALSDSISKIIPFLGLWWHHILCCAVLDQIA